MSPLIEAFFDHNTYTFSYVVSDPRSNKCAIIDSVLDYDAAVGRISKNSANTVIEFVHFIMTKFESGFFKAEC